MNWNQTVWPLLLLSVSAWGLTGCNSQSPPAAAGSPPPPAVTVAPVEEREWVETEEFVGRTEAVEHVEIRPRVSGYLQEVRFQSGQRVKQGDVLFVIDPRTRQAALARAEADVLRARSTLQNAQAEAARVERLLGTKAISKEEADTRLWKVADAQSVLLSAEAARDSARLELEFCEVKSPVNGQVSRALITPGNNVSGVDGATSLLTTVVSLDPVYVLSDVAEATILRFKRFTQAAGPATNASARLAVRMALADEVDFPRAGHIESMDNRLNPDTGSLLVRSVFPNPDGLLLPGLFVRVKIPVGQPSRALFINDRAIGTDQSQKFVLVLTASNTVAYRPVKLGPSSGGQRVVRQGLHAGEQVVVNGLQRVRPGMPVTPAPEPQLTVAQP
jgi:multidrug efflux system membrane fusion protein